MSEFSGFFSEFADWAVRVQLRLVNFNQDPETGQPTAGKSGVPYDGLALAFRSPGIPRALQGPITGAQQDVPSAVIVLPYCALPPLGVGSFDVYLPDNGRRVYLPLQSPLDSGDQHEIWIIPCKEGRPTG
jgi:hypothetical protein